jgi:hypothetical protein
MPLSEETIDLDAEIDRLTDEMEAQAEIQAEYPQGSAGARQAAQEGQRAERFRTGLRWFRGEYDAESVTFAAITHGERELINKIADDGPQGTRTNAYVAVATRDAPYLEHEPPKVPDNEAAIRQTVARIPNLHPSFVDWAESKIHDIGSMDADEGNAYRQLVQAKRTSET